MSPAVNPRGTGVLSAALLLAVTATAGCGLARSEPAEPPDPPEPGRVTQTPSDDQADGPRGDPLGILGGGEWAGIDLGEVKDACDSIREDIDGVEAAAASIEQDLLVDDVPYLEQDADELYDHLLAVEQLEEHFADSDLGDEVTERADAVNAVLEELDFGDVDGLDEALDWVAETHVPLLEFCEL